jgi:hypothetical protein
LASTDGAKKGTDAKRDTKRDPKDSAAAYKDGIATPKVATEPDKAGTERGKVKESFRSIYLIALKRYCALGAPKL